MESKIKVQRKIKLPNNIIEALNNIPETGMGFHKIHFILEDCHITQNECILNSEYLLIDKKYSDDITFVTSKPDDMIQYDYVFGNDDLSKKSDEEITEMLNNVIGITTNEMLEKNRMIKIKK